jgi:predicted nucleotidyltransferase
MLISMWNILSSHKAREILNLLLEGEKSLPEVTDHLGISKPATIKYLNDMERMGLVSSEMSTTKVGRVKVFKVHSYCFVFSIDPKRGGMVYQNNDPLYHHNPFVGQVEQDEFRAAVNIYMFKIAEKLKIDFATVLYGSIARGEGTAKSDIDLLLLSKNEWKEKDKNIIMNALHEGSIKTQIQVKPQFWTLKDFLQKRDNLIKRIKSEGMILYDSIKDEKLWKSMKRYWDIRD